ncbi:hypothetical protein B7C51_25030 (plasmid) [Paenibacillus larvae subsp. pulvifaciens]|uniref:Uncharacterized protein n=1 Tax=Paenibacillus larvae subsp. pulvifaciens TaxID=1477 RepID=A0A1V0V011_9BACL|nr:hypothetical protein [Paenibacillus larvae]ARF70739.1 hypothetical protein B7C51_25030 [Paenibacillus larvae subsp. pulvifaciens]
MKIEVSEKDFIKNVKKCIREAASYNCELGGVVQLYATHDGEKITEYFTSVFPSCNSWIEGENLIHVTTYNYMTKNQYKNMGIEESVRYAMYRLEERFDIKWV